MIPVVFDLATSEGTYQLLLFAFFCNVVKFVTDGREILMRQFARTSNDRVLHRALWW